MRERWNKLWTLDAAPPLDSEKLPHDPRELLFVAEDRIDALSASKLTAHTHISIVNLRTGCCAGATIISERPSHLKELRELCANLGPILRANAKLVHTVCP